MLIGINVESREQVDAMIWKAAEAEGTVYRELQGHGRMYDHSFTDPDGHQWEVFHMDANTMPKE